VFDYTHLTPLEQAARLFCQTQDQDPDVELQVPHPMGLEGVKFTRPAWHFPAENMLNLSLMLACMKRFPAAAPAATDVNAH
jgi:hypothetical protein